MLSFPYVPIVTAGDPVTSGNLATLADAVNSRLRSGVGDPTWRIVWYFFNLWRSIRYPSETGAEPTQAEFLEFYQHIDPSESNVTWPETGFDEYEGIRTANPMGAFIGGSPWVDSEDVRLSGENTPPLWFDTGVPINATERWNIGRSQRGVYDPATGNQNVPAFTAAQSYFRIAHTQFYHKSYGGFQPTPRRLGDCGDETEDTQGTPKYQFRFTNLRDNSVKVYTGACPPDSPGGADANNVVYIARMPFAYYIFFSAPDRPPERLPISEWIEGPYQTGGVLQKQDGGQLTRIALNNYIKDYRGSEDQRDLSDEGKQFDAYDLSEIAFDFERFFAGQYFLAPVIGHTNGNSIDTDYPGFIWDAASYAAGSLARYLGDSSTAHQIADGFVYAGCLIRGYGLQSAVNVEVLDGNTVLATVDLEAGDSSQISMLDNAGRVNLRYRLVGAVAFNPGGRIEIEAAELLEYKPQIHDAYLLLRLSSTQGDSVSVRVDGRGRDSFDAKTFSDSYFGNGMIVNGRAAGLPLQGLFGINDNPVFDAARAFTREHVRITNRRQFIGYEVNGEGKSVLYFLRHAYGSDQDNPVDTFWNIAPPKAAVPSGRIRQGFTYTVRGGSIFYPTVEAATSDHPVVIYSEGETFAGLSGFPDFTVSGQSAAEVFQREGILPVAPRLGETNEWLMFCQFKVYHESNPHDPSDTSAWSIGGYTDYITFSNRCQFYSPEITPLSKPELVRHFQYGSAIATNPEAPTGYNYADGTNRFRRSSEEERLRFYKSCQIYQPDDEIESATVHFESGVEIVKLVFKSRLQHCAEAPSTITRPVESWDIDALRAEPYRTTENGLREYLVWLVKFINAAPGRTGDAAGESEVWGLPDNPFGAVFPTFFFTHLVPKPSEEDPANETIQSDQDTRCTVDPLIQAETYLRAMCEGYVDGITSAASGCGGTEQDPTPDPVPVYAAEFTTGSPLANYLLMADDVNLPAPFMPAGTSFTAGTRVKFRSKDTSGADLISRYQGGGNEQFLLGYSVAGDQFYCVVVSSGGVPTALFSSVSGVALDQWYDVTMQLDIPNNALRIYVNGVMTEVAYTGGLKNSGTGLIIGNRGSNPGGLSFDGFMRGTFLDKTVWTDANIIKLHQNHPHITDFEELELPAPTVWYEYDNALNLGRNYTPATTYDLSNFTGTNGPVVQSIELEDQPVPGPVPFQGGMFDYTFENLCYQAFGGRWINTISTTVRPDRPQGFGPLPNTVMYAEIYNQLAKCLNLLDKARVMLPFRLQCKTADYATERPVTPDWADGGVCSPTSTNKGIWSGVPPAPSGFVKSTDWEDCDGISSSSAGGFDPTDQCVGTSFKLRSIKSISSYRFALIDPLSINAVPTALRELIETESFGFLAQKILLTFSWQKEVVSNSADADGCSTYASSGFFYDSGLGMGWKFNARNNIPPGLAMPPGICGLYNSGALPVGNPPQGDFFVGRGIGADPPTCANSSGQVVNLVLIGEQPNVYVLVPLSGAPAPTVEPGVTPFPGTVDTSAPVDTSTPI